MTSVPVNPDLIYISTVHKGCTKLEFDSRYPLQLTGIINQDEFQESINKINRAFSPNDNMKYIVTFIVMCFIAIPTCFFLGRKSEVISGRRRQEFTPFIGVGVGIAFAACIIGFIGHSMMSRRVARAEQVIKDESMKYSSRSPISCSWRLHITKESVDGSRNVQPVYHLAINTGRRSAPESAMNYSNQVAPESTESSRQQECAPPPYPGLPTNTCSQSVALQHDQSTRFISSNGHLYQ